MQPDGSVPTSLVNRRALTEHSLFSNPLREAATRLSFDDSLSKCGLGVRLGVRRGRKVVQSRIDFVVASPDSGWTSGNADWLLSDHSSIGGSLVIDEVKEADRREVVDWDKLAATLADEDERWYGDLVGETAYDKLLDLRRRHLKMLRVCGKSKR